MARLPRLLVAAVLVAALGLVALGLAQWAPDARVAAQGGSQGTDIYLPLLLRLAAREELVGPRLATPLPTATTQPTATETPAPTATPTPEPTATPTEVVGDGRIRGRITVAGQPAVAGFGAPGFGPQIELQRRSGGAWATVPGRTAMTVEGGTFEFTGVAPLAEGDAYRVQWRNEESFGGADLWLSRWWSRPITAFGPSASVDVGTFEVANLALTAICHDCLQTLPITFKWDVRPGNETYRWALFRECADIAKREGAYRTAPLGHVGQYTLNSPPPGFVFDQRYCWFVQIEDGAGGYGWSYYDWRVTFCSSAATCR